MLDRLTNPRRNFLKRALWTSGGLALSPYLGHHNSSWAQNSADNRHQRFLFAYFDGGWDQLLALDPRDPQTTRPDFHRIDPAYERLGAGARGIQRVGQLSFGPAIPPSFLRRHANRFTIIRGVNMNTAAHEVGRRYFITGQFPRGLSAVGSSTAAEIADFLGDNTTIPYIAAAVEAYARDLGPHARPLTVNSLSDLSIALTPFTEIQPAVLDAVQVFQDQAASCTSRALDTDGLATQLRDSQVRARAYLEGQIARIFDTSRTDAEMQTLRERYQLAGVANFADPRMLGFAAGQALKSGVSQVVSVRVAEGLDTHSAWATSHPGALEAGFSVLTSILDDLAATPSDAGGTVLDHTTVLAFSEFARTPLLNALDGRDHFLGNSCLICGPKFVKGRVIGGSADIGMMPVDLNPSTGEPEPNATEEMRANGAVIPVAPEHILATVLKSVGASYEHLRKPSLDILFAQ